MLDQTRPGRAWRARLRRCGDGTEHRAVELPRDSTRTPKRRPSGVYTGAPGTTAGRRFGFELVFFKRRTDLDRFGVVPLRLIANPLYLAHFAITDESRGKFRYEHRKSAGGVFDLPARASNNRYYLKLGNWTAREAHGLHILRATLGDNLVFEVALKPAKPVVLRHEAQRRQLSKTTARLALFLLQAHGGRWRHPMATRNGTFTGEAWMDRIRHVADARHGSGDWFNPQSLPARMMAYHIRAAKVALGVSGGSYVEPDGRRTHLAREDFTLEAKGRWRSPHTGAVYPSGWRLRVPRFGVDVSITPVVKDQELDTRGTTMIVYWEGACAVSGRHGDAETQGRAYAELVGYERSHLQPQSPLHLRQRPRPSLPPRALRLNAPASETVHRCSIWRRAGFFRPSQGQAAPLAVANVKGRWGREARVDG